MLTLIRTILIIAGLLTVVIGSFLFLRPYAERTLFLMQKSPFERVQIMLRDDPDARVRGQAALTLVNIDRARAVPYLITALRTDAATSSDVREALVQAGVPAVEALHALGLEELRKPDYDKSLLENIINTLIRIKQPAVDTLVDLLGLLLARDDLDKELIDNILFAMATEEITVQRGVDLWIRIIQDQRFGQGARRNAITVLGKARPSELNNILGYLESPELKLSVIKAIRDSKDVNFIALLAGSFYADQDPSVRSAAIEATGFLLREEQQQAESGATPTPTFEAPSPTPTLEALTPTPVD